jgi:hypothetical protein
MASNWQISTHIKSPNGYLNARQKRVNESSLEGVRVPSRTWRTSGRALPWFFVVMTLFFLPQSASAAEVDGFYLSGSAGFLWGVRSTHAWTTDCPEIAPASPLVAQALNFTSWAPPCSTRPPLGLMMEGRFGLRFKYIGLEGFLLGSADWSSAGLGGDPPIPIPKYAQQMEIGRVGGGPGIGIRFMTKPKPVQFTIGAGGGIFARFVYSNVSSLDGSSVSYLAPMARGDLSFVFAKHFIVGVMGWAEFSESVTVRPDLGMLGLPAAPDGGDLLTGLDKVTVFQGTQFFLAPYLGIQFGK